MKNNRIEHLNSDETVLLENHAKMQKANLKRLLYLFIGIAVAGFFITSISTHSWYAGAIAALSWICITGFIFFTSIYPNYLKIKIDLENSQKETITGIINHKIKQSDEHSDDYFFYIGISNTRIKVSIEDYNQFKEGDQIEIHQTIKSKLVLKINSINETQLLLTFFRVLLD